MQKISKIIAAAGVSALSLVGQGYATMTAPNVDKVDTAPFLVTRIGVNEDKMTLAWRRKAEHISIAIWDMEHYMQGYTEGVVDRLAFEGMTEGEVEWGRTLIDIDVSNKATFTEMDVPIAGERHLRNESLPLIYYAVKWDDGSYFRGKLRFDNCLSSLVNGEFNPELGENVPYEAGVWECQVQEETGMAGLSSFDGGTYMSDSTAAALSSDGRSALLGLTYKAHKIDESDTALPGDIKTLKTVAAEQLTGAVPEGLGGSGSIIGGDGAITGAGEAKKKVPLAPNTGVPMEDEVAEPNGLWYNRGMQEGFWMIIAFTLGWLIAQTVKTIGVIWQQRGVSEVGWRLILETSFKSGGMPSGHTASLSALAMYVGLAEGFGSSVFALALAMLAIVIYDAVNVRWAVGEQGKMLKNLMRRKMRIVEGHTIRQVIVGLLIGVMAGSLLFLIVR